MWSLGLVSVMRRAEAFYTLQRSDGRLWKACEYSVAVVQSAEHECCDQTLGDFFTSRVTDLTQSPQLKEATADNTTDVLLHRQLIVKHRINQSINCMLKLG